MKDREIKKPTENTYPSIKLIIFDWKRTLYDPDQKTLFPEVEQMLQRLFSKGLSLVLLGMGDLEMLEETKRLRINKYFEHIEFLTDKTTEVFSRYIADPAATLVVGDRVRREIEIGNLLGAKTIQIKQGKFSDEKPLSDNQKPLYQTDSLKGLLKILKVEFGIE